MTTPTDRVPPSAAGRVLAAANAWRQDYNPLRWLDINRATLLLERERRGDLSEIQWVYEIIDGVDPDMLALIKLRTAAIQRMRLDVAACDPQTRGYDRPLAADQEAALREALGRIGIEDAIEDMALATFRGFTIQQILRDASGMPVGLSCLDRWLFARDGYRGAWWWNPRAAGAAGRALPARDRIGGEELPLADFVIREERLAVDRACLTLGIRTSTCDKDWDAWCEMYGLNQAILTEPPNAAPGDRPAYNGAARAFSDGQGGTIPHGSAVTFPQAARGAPPFQARVDHLTRRKVLAGTSGRLTMLAESGTGTLAGSAHQDTFDALADAEAADICKLYNRTLAADILGRLYPGRPRLVSIALVRNAAEDKDKAAARIAQLAPHYDIDAAAASDLTGLKLRAKAAHAAAPGAPPPAPSPGAPEDVQSLALNGAQIASMVQILSAAAEGTLPKESVVPMLQAAFPSLKPETVARIADPVFSFRPAPETPAADRPAALNAMIRSHAVGVLHAAGRASRPASARPDPAPVYRALADDMAVWRARAAGLLRLPPEERPAAARELADEAARDEALAPALKEALGGWIAGAYAAAAADAAKTPQERKNGGSE